MVISVQIIRISDLVICLEIRASAGEFGCRVGFTGLGLGFTQGWLWMEAGAARGPMVGGEVPLAVGQRGKWMAKAEGAMSIRRRRAAVADLTTIVAEDR